MTERLKEYRLADLLHSVIDNRGKTPPISAEGHPLIETICINNSSKYPDYSKVSKFVSEHTFNTWFRKGHPQKGDILISTVGANIGNVGLMNEDLGCIAQNLVGLRVKSAVCNSDFLYYFLSARGTQLTLKGLDIGSAQPSIKVPHLLNLKIACPPLQTQASVAEILSSLDGKIELNNQINQNLEDLAQATFKRWFIDFEFPNENGQPYKSSGGEMVESDLGEAPLNWRSAAMKEEFSIKMGQSPKGETYNESNDGLLFFQGSTDFGFRFPTERMYTTDPKKIANRFDTLLSVRAPVGTINMALHRCCIGRGIGAISSPSEKVHYTYYKMLSLRSVLKQFDNEGTVFGSINKDTLGNIKVIRPEERIVNLFDEIVEPIDNLIYNNHTENLSLIALRDSLLPKLISGAITIRGSDKILNKA